MAIEVREIDSYYGDLQVLRRVSLTVNEREVVALFGPNGHGKSTLLKAIAGMHPPYSGSIKYLGREISGATTERIVQMGMAYIPEERLLFPNMTVLENLNLGAYNRNARSRIRENLDSVFALFPRLKERKDQMCSTLSGGEGRMVAIGRGLMSAASFLMVDEPSIGLSPVMKDSVFGAIQKINQEKNITILIVDQEIRYALRLAERIYMMKRGEVIFERDADEIDVAEIEKAYF